MSQAIKALEHRLGVRLLHRTTREVTLTTTGAVFLDACRTLVGASTAADAAVRQAADGQAGELRIGAVTSAFGDPLPRLLELFQAAHPRLDVRAGRSARTSPSSHCAAARSTWHSPARHPARLQRVTLRREPFVLAVPVSWAPASDEPWDLAATAELPWIWLPRSISPDYHDQVVACCRAAGFAPDARHLARSIYSQLAMVASGLGVALVPAGPRTGPRTRPPPASGSSGSSTPPPSTSPPSGAARPALLVEGFIASARSAIGAGDPQVSAAAPAR